MITDPLLAGGTAAIILKGLSILEQFVQKRRNGTNGNGYSFKDASAFKDQIIAEIAKTRHDVRDVMSEGVAQAILDHREVMAKLDVLHRDVLSQ